ncbi:MAG: YraN family protein [Myxococcota bacterium]
MTVRPPEPEGDARRSAVAFGKAAEAFVARQLASDGWAILAANWRGAGVAACELDLVVSRAGALRFVEVKARTQEQLDDALEALTPDKQARLRRAAEAWFAAFGLPEREAAFLLAVVTAASDGSPLTVTWWDDPF